MTSPLFSARHLSKRYGATTVVDDLSFDIAPGECLGVIGPNGAGKTTTIRMCLGLSVPDAGTIEAEDDPSLQGRGGVVQVDDCLLGAADRLVGALDEVLA